MPAALLAIATVFAWPWADEPNVEALSARFDREKSPVWADGDTATFFYRGEAARVEVIAGGDFKSLTRIPSSNAWTVALKLPDLERAVISYYFTVTKNKGGQNSPTPLPGVWRGPKAPEPAAETSRAARIAQDARNRIERAGHAQKTDGLPAAGFRAG